MKTLAKDFGLAVGP